MREVADDKLPLSQCHDEIRNTCSVCSRGVFLSFDHGLLSFPPHTAPKAPSGVVATVPCPNCLTLSSSIIAALRDCDVSWHIRRLFVTLSLEELAALPGVPALFGNDAALELDIVESLDRGLKRAGDGSMQFSTVTVEI